MKILCVGVREPVCSIVCVASLLAPVDINENQSSLDASYLFN